MSIKDVLMMVIVAVGIMWATEYVISRFTKKSPQTEEVAVQAGQSYVAPKTVQEIKPQNEEVAFVEGVRLAPATKVDVETPTIHALFSTDGATLELLEFKRGEDLNRRIATIQTCGDANRELRCFLVALDEQTPYYYNLVAKHDDAEATHLTFEATSAQGIIRKTFVVWKEKYQIDLDLQLVPEQGRTMTARIFYPTPSMQDEKKDPKSLVVSSLGGSIKKIGRSSLEERTGWFEPTLFGSDDRYFIHTLVSDPDKFVQRAYYKLLGQDNFLSIIEGPAVTKDTTYKTSFYFGPKEITAMRAVDGRLEKTLDYSTLLAPLYKFFLAMLLFFFAYLKNYGLAIIALTIALRVLLLPITLRGERGMKKHAEMQKKLEYIQQRYKHDPELLAQEKQELIRKYGVPGIGSCLPMLLQLPLFYIIMRLLSTSVELYGAPFLWMSDITASDPYYILPVLVCLSMVAQALVGDPKSRVQFLVMALLFGAFAVSFSAGVCLYLAVGTLLGVAQVLIQKRFKAA